MLLLVLGLFWGGGLLPVVVPPCPGPVLAPPHPAAATIRSRVIRAASRMMSSERKRRISLSNHAVRAFVPGLAGLVLSRAPEQHVDLFRGNGTAEHEALGECAAHLAKEPRLLVGFNAFGDRLQPEIPNQADD